MLIAIENAIAAQRYTQRVLQKIKLILLCVSAEPAVLGSAKTALEFNMKFKQAITHIQFNVWGRVQA